MPTLSTLLLFALFSFILAITPGPDMLLLVSRSATQGRRAGMAALVGTQVGCVIYAMAAGFGLSELFNAVPAAFETVRWAGAAYLLYIAWRTITGRDETASGSTAVLAAPSLPVLFRQGLFTNLLNPKVALFMLALWPQFMAPGTTAVLEQAVVMAVIFVSIGAAVNVVVVVVADRAGQWLLRRLSQRSARIALASVFAGLAARLAWN